jgi:hypothetical protein
MMKKLFNNIDQSEKERILEMHKSATKKNYLMNEQGQTTTPSDERMKNAKAEELKNRKEEEIRRKEEEEKRRKKEEDENLLKKYKNKTGNMYSDEDNDEVVQSNYKIDGVEKLNDASLKINLSNFKSKSVIFDCREPKKLKADRFLGKDKIYYSNNLTSSLQKDFCTKSTGGKSVPKVDFASTNRPSGQNFA